MTQLNVFCEGPTEQGFCVQVLQPHLFPNSEGIIHTLAVGEKRHRHVYGLGSRAKYERIRKFIRNTIKQRRGPNIFFTTLFDLYELPGDFPGKDANTYNAADPTRYVLALEAAMQDDIGYHQFISHLQLHEYETMLFAAPEAFKFAFEGCEAEVQQLTDIGGSVATIEHINQGRDTAPSKRIEKIIPEYKGRKSSAGPDIAEYIGLETIREKCPHVDHWVSRLESRLR